MANERILIVEDMVITAKDIQNMLNAMGYDDPIIALSGEEGIKKAEKIKPDLVLMDIVLPGVDGIDAAEEIRNRFDIPVVFLTAHTDERTIQRAKLTFPLGYLLKPFDGRLLHTTIEMGLYRHKLEKALRENVERLNCFMASLPDGFFLFDSELNCIEINNAAERVFGLTKEEVIGKNISVVLPDLKGGYDKYLEVIKKGKTVFIDDLTPNPGFGGIHIAVRAFKVCDGLGIITTDITERKRMEEELR